MKIERSLTRASGTHACLRRWVSAIPRQRTVRERKRQSSRNRTRAGAREALDVGAHSAPASPTRPRAARVT